MGSGESTQPFWAIPKVNYRMITSLDKTSEASIAGVCVSRAESNSLRCPHTYRVGEVPTKPRRSEEVEHQDKSRGSLSSRASVDADRTGLLIQTHVREGRHHRPVVSKRQAFVGEAFTMASGFVAFNLAVAQYGAVSQPRIQSQSPEMQAYSDRSWRP
jgi:hypothetical protein